MTDREHSFASRNRWTATESIRPPLFSSRRVTVEVVTIASRTGPLRGQHVELVPLEVEFAADLAAAAVVDRATYRYTTVPEGPAATEAYVRRLLNDRDADRVVPFAQRHVATGRLVGCTRFMEIRWWRGRPEPDEVEIGGTWLSADVQRSAVNTEAKLLLLTHAFETWNVVRVALCTDERNERSRRAIEGIGARFEGVLHNHRPSYSPDERGRPRQSALFAITDTEWPAVRARLGERLARRGRGHQDESGVPHSG